MIGYYWNSDYRNLMKRKKFSFINVFGLAIGMASALLILTYVTFEFSFDKMHTKYQHISRVQSTFREGEVLTDNWASSSFGYGSAMKENLAGIEDYTRCLEEFTSRLSITNPILLGHSFGGRVSILYGSRNAVKKIILVDAAGIKPRRTLNYYIKVYPYKWAKKLMPILMGRQTAQRYLDRYRQKVGSSDYKNLSGTMRGTFIKVVNEDLKKFMPSIQAPTLLIWGELDTATPVKDAKIMNKLIPDSGLVVLKGCGNYSFLDN